MCGIAGYHGLTNAGEALLENMNCCQQHRGPDGTGTFVDDGVGLAHQRLAIIDVDHGQQPMRSEDGRFTLAYNGEVYNYLELRAELEDLGRTFRTDSDTEVVLQAYAEWGTQAFDRFNGMWGLAIWDSQERTLVLSRDHFGIKPIYVAEVSQDDGRPGILFASEIKGILAYDGITARPNERAIYRYIMHRIHEQGRETFFHGIERLQPGEMMILTDQGVRREPYTRLRQELLENSHIERTYDAAAVAEYRRRFVESVRLRLQSEVPVGTSLSGGLDSSAVAVVINKLLADGEQTSTASVGSQQNTFSAVFPNSINDEEKYVDDVLELCAGKVNAHKIKPSPSGFLEDLRDFVRTQEEPIISTGPYAQYCVMREATKHVTVLLDGQGADEMMAGYIPYYFVYFRQLRDRRRYLKLALEFVRSLDILWRLGRFRVLGKLKRAKNVDNRSFLRQGFVQAYRGESFPVEQRNLKKRLVQDLFENSLPSLLRYEDKNTMRFSLEGRVPFLDKEVVKFLFSLSDDAIIHAGWNKRALRDATRGLLPGSISGRRNKIGFTTPQDEWFRSMHSEIRSILASESFGSRPWFDQKAILAAFDDYIAGRIGNANAPLWRLVNVELWMREFIDQSPTAH
ncbi:asparagine synthase (glutamine-hydrolyzing) [Devriesea agamarum]|uniref:asparagine synthase (glutamine-hydrolyzing) n=1 Tax=Devriesea agamarum TaxID=472569 RepID=UPI00071E2F34|nr:asparagine synthase (glutamine-hydrolyzing) [Devriesea agamarum]